MFIPEGRRILQTSGNVYGIQRSAITVPQFSISSEFWMRQKDYINVSGDARQVRSTYSSDKICMYGTSYRRRFALRIRRHDTVGCDT